MATGFYKIKIYGSCAPRSKVKVLLANHTAMVEVLVMYVAAGLPRFVLVPWLLPQRSQGGHMNGRGSEEGGHEQLEKRLLPSG